jgi:hypothetical protein
MTGEARRGGAARIRQLVFPGDGAAWIWNLATHHFPHPDRGPLPRPRAPARPGQKVSFLRPAAPGRITVTGRVVHRGGSTAFLAGELRDETGDVLATATATVRIIRPHRH